MAKCNKIKSSATWVKWKPVFGPLMEAADITTIQVEYCGGGDAGQIENITFAGQNGQLSGDTLPDACNKIGQILDQVFDDVMEETGHTGWESNDGGGGTMTITRSGIQMEHQTYFTDAINFEYELS